MNATAISVTIVSSLLSGLISVFITTYYYRRYDRKKMKFDILRRLAGSRYCLVPDSNESSKKEFFEALNEVFIVFHDDEKVLNTLEIFHKELNIAGIFSDSANNNLVKLFRAIIRNLGIEYKTLTDEFFLKPFSLKR